MSTGTLLHGNHHSVLAGLTSAHRLAVVERRVARWLSGCLAVGLACGDQRRLTGNGSALEVVLHDDALYKSTTLLYFFYF